MNAAKYYIYRNLHTGGFSIRHRGLVIERADDIVAENVTFKVNDGGRQRVIREKSKNVHAFVVCDKYKLTVNNNADLKVITYNPYKLSTFTCEDQPIASANKVALSKGKCYLVE